MMATRKMNPLKDRATELGYTGPTDFVGRSGCPLSFETVRIGIWEGKPVNTHSLILLLKYLQYTPDEIGEYLRAMGEKEYSELMVGGKAQVLPEWQKILLRVIGDLRKQAPAEYNTVVDMLILAAKGTGIAVDDVEIKRVKAKG